MELNSFPAILQFILNLDASLGLFVETYGVWVYGLLFLVIFSETGLVILPFLPGDSLLFLTGALCGTGALNLWFAAPLIGIAAVLGNACNYTIGRFLGHKLITSQSRFFLKKEHLDKTHRLYEKYGGPIVVYSRFMPIVRTFAPFVAGLGSMGFWKFQGYNLAGAFLWVMVFLGSGYLFGNMPIVQNNLSTVMGGIILVSLLPAILSFLRLRFKKETD